MNQNRLARWCLILALVACGLAAGLAQAAPAAPGFPAAAPAHPAATPPDMDAEAVKELKEQIKALEERERSNYAMAIETQRKSVDWWLTAIGAFLAVFGLVATVLGVFVPAYWTRKERKRVDQALAQSEAELAKIRTAQTLAADALAMTQQHAQSAEKKSTEAEAALKRIKKIQFDGKSSTAPNAAEKESQRRDAATVLASAEVDDLGKLRALAVKAGEDENAQVASHLWQAVATQSPDDATALFNAAYWLQEELSRRVGAVSPAEWHRVSDLYAAHCELDQRSHWGVNNWGIALAEEANAVLANANLEEARKYWALAGAKFQRALQIKADMHEAAFNWGLAFAVEAGLVFAADGLPEARRLWALAGTKFQLALQIKADEFDAAGSWGSALLQEASALESMGMHANAQALLHQARDLLHETTIQSDDGAKAVAYNLACVWARLGDVAQCIAQLQLAHAAGKLPDPAHLDSDRDLDAVRGTPEYQAWRQGLPAPWNPVEDDPQASKGTR